MSEKPRHPEKVNKPINPIKKKPDWIRSKIVDSQVFFQTKKVVNQNNLVTVCQEANCPNITECWSKKHATFMIMGDTCTRALVHVSPIIINVACFLLQHSVIFGQFASWQTVTRLFWFTTFLV